MRITDSEAFDADSAAPVFQYYSATGTCRPAEHFCTPLTTLYTTVHHGRGKQLRRCK